jgi:hypothetical protein
VEGHYTDAAVGVAVAVEEVADEIVENTCIVLASVD